ncbi:hypothetical protein ACIP9G_00625 [Lysinibacillus sp. NPDC093197]|uniref:hypothetical protein n=1 Tax=Lysinibacillus sp. NPDC093197 TaxID=3364132 RepID=UPI00382CB864
MFSKKKSIVTIVSMSLISNLVIVPFNPSKTKAVENTNIVEATDNAIFSEQQLEEVQIIADHVSYERKDGVGVFTLSNIAEMEIKLQNINSIITVNEISSAIADINTKLADENGNGETTELLVKSRNLIQYGTETAPRIVKRSCSKWLGGLGLAHVTATTGAGLLLGISGPVGWTVGTGIAAAYYLGSLACPN